MDEDTKLRLQYRFSGYQLPKIQLDDTGNSYVRLKNPHPYYSNQPFYWTKPIHYGSFPNLGADSREIKMADPNNITLLK